MTGPDLKPCPFCGRKMDITDDLRHYNHPMSACFGRHIGIAAGDIDRIDLWNRRDPAVLAALPEVQALIAAAYEAAADLVRHYPHTMLMTPDQKLVCNHLGDAIRRHPRAATADATAALAARDAAMIARGMREAAGIAWALEGGDRWTRGAAQNAILARAAEIEGDSK